MKSDSLAKGSENFICCGTQCRKTYIAEGQMQVNNFKCNQPQFSSQDLWKLRQQKKTFAIRNYLN